MLRWLPLALAVGVAADSDCYPVAANTTGDTLTVITTGETPDGFTSAAKGWNSWGVQGSPETTPSYNISLYPDPYQEFIEAQCTILANSSFVAAGYDLCSIDGGWSSSITDDYGRVTYNTTLFPDLPALSTYLHGLGLKLGLYSRPSIPCEATNKTIYGTNITVGSTFSGVEDTDGDCFFDYSNPDTQLYHDSLIDLWASWDCDMIKLDYLTPGSETGISNYPANTSASAIAYHQAIENNGRQMRLDLSSNVCRDEGYPSIWEATAESMRVSVDIDSYGASVFVGMWRAQQTIDEYRLYINQLVANDTAMTLHPDMDNLFVGNPEDVTGLTDGQRIMIMSHWIGASANLILGSDLTNVDDLGLQLITSKESIAAANFCSNYPMQLRNPGTGSNQPMQLQAWISGPDDAGEAYVLLTNLGENQGHGGYITVTNGTANVTISLADLGLTGSQYNATDVWYGNSTIVEEGGSLSASLGQGDAQFLQLIPL